MGKPFSNELDLLAETYEWCQRAQTTCLTSHIHACMGRPLYAVGSGGSLAAAHFQALLHQQSGTMARAVTPLDVSFGANTLSDTSVFFLSAGGGNPDVLASFRLAAVNEPRSLGGLCMHPGSPLKSLADQYWFSKLIEYDLPAGKDGFLATNSLLALMVLLARAYGHGEAISRDASGLLLQDSRLAELKRTFHEARPDDSWLILYGGWCMPVAMDLESKLSEAALAHAHLADYRNFAHGRHHWLAKRNKSTTVVALSTPSERELSERTLSLLPRDIPVLRLQTEANGPAATIGLYVSMLHLVRMLGERCGIDPGRPGVPEFGRRIYNLRYAPKPVKIPGLNANEQAAIRRKVAMNDLSQLPQAELEEWEKAYRTFRRRLGQQEFGAAVFDYDGTLCYTPDRFDPLCEPVTNQLTRLLEAGVLIGIATGRGKSARKELLALPDQFHERVYIGYHNCGEIRTLAAEPPSSDCLACADLIGLVRAIDADHGLRPLFKLTVSERQITFEANGNTTGAMIADLLRPHMRKHGGDGCQIVASSHSVDILAPGVSKVLLVDLLRSQLADGSEVLCVGDKGRWPGNDYLLLEEPYSLSVDEVSGSKTSCWNIATAGHVGTQATVEYLGSLTPAGMGTVTFGRQRLRG